MSAGMCGTWYGEVSVVKGEKEIFVFLGLPFLSERAPLRYLFYLKYNCDLQNVGGITIVLQKLK